MGFQQSAHQAAVYQWDSGHFVLLVGIYVDNLIITGAEEKEVQSLKAQMKEVFDFDMPLCPRPPALVPGGAHRCCRAGGVEVS
jgi:hypothetical protein